MKIRCVKGFLQEYKNTTIEECSIGQLISALYDCDKYILNGYEDGIRENEIIIEPKVLMDDECMGKILITQDMVGKYLVFGERMS